jgi:hypothetical protein
VEPPIAYILPFTTATPRPALASCIGALDIQEFSVNLAEEDAEAEETICCRVAPSIEATSRSIAKQASRLIFFANKPANTHISIMLRHHKWVFVKVF